MPVTREDVICAYRLLLNRDPESEEAIEGHRGAADLGSLRHIFMSSAEYRSQNSYLQGWMVAPVFDESRLLWVNMKDSYVSAHCITGVYEAENSTIVRTLLREDSVFLDVGANIGWFTVLASTVIGPAGRIHCFEPQPHIADRLRRTIEINRLEDLVSFHRKGVWSEPGSMALTGNSDSQNQGAGHLAPAGHDASESSIIDLVTLDSLGLDRCDLIKMDIEGAEPRAMDGAERLLREARPVILSELNSGQLKTVSGTTGADYIKAMEQRGYDCIKAHGPDAGRQFSPETALSTVFADILFIPREKADATLGQLFGQSTTQ
ncbi:FkbM family methyltransferase [Rhizorhabdus phycosphaerae]|uniref:FkbM family methyltransferase n=1 Tax=Rhizorhabdus phycosphaerae TaxID=2711156 RepID=UPI0013EDEFEB|nr:FkbM family methyltransferase [Rhizorhabdus phycosphaerae]